MGIPKFFRWLTRRYPLILKNISREEDCPPIDNLYLDLNGIVHNCIHGNDAKLHEKVSKLAAQGDFDEVWVNIMKAIDEIIHTVKPRQTLFLALDGVAPRAKMNQQRARRFRSAKDSQLLKEKLQAEGKEAPNLFDSNAISPGTKFMFELNRQLEFFIQYKLNTDPLYQKLEVVLSDSSVPGEGEHKMMDYIRQAKTKEEYNPNTRHCFYGADADLIMLSLLTHEPNFMIIREEHVVRKIKQGGVQRLDIQKTFNFQLIFINLLREYFQFEYSEIQPKMRMRFDLERIIDDFVFFCFFIGNDFLPSLSALDISEGSLDQMIDLYKSLLPEMTDYITEAGTIHWDRAEPFVRMLGNHELESFKMRVDSIRHARDEKIVSFQADFGLVGAGVDRTTLIKNKIREKLNEKKVVKIFRLKEKNRHLQYKKIQLLKRFEEDQEREQELSKFQKDARKKLIDKYRAKRIEQEQSPQTQSESDKKEPIDASKLQTLHDIIDGLKDEYFSDLNIHDIGDDEVSDVNEEDIDVDNVGLADSNPELRQKLKVQEEIIDKYSEANLQFMNEFIRLFGVSSDAAKAFYYNKKLSVDVKTPEGQSFQKKMLRKYLEGLQWVLYYYYRGAQHWRWYYPYHYAPMISDIDENIVQNLLAGKVIIEQFEIDANCSDVNVPYTPFQQLLSIMPLKSMHLLPDMYREIAELESMKDFYPLDFDIDLNGRALPWEAACLIPFVDEKTAISFEQQYLQVNPLNEDDQKRNTIYFYFKKFQYSLRLKRDPTARGKPLVSSIKRLEPLPHNFVTTQLLFDYQDVGKHSFLPKLLPGVDLPCVDFPSLKWLGANSVTYDEKVVNKVAFKRVLVKAPSCMEDRSTEDLEKYVNQFVKQANKELFIGIPYQIEGFPTIFEDERFSYHIYGDVYTNVYKIHKEQQQMDKDKFAAFQRRQSYKLQDIGIQVDMPRAFVTIAKLKEIKYDSKQHYFYKIYENEAELMPLQIAMKRRDPSHYLNMNMRCNHYLQSFKPERQVLCLNMQLFGVVGRVQQVDIQRGNVKVEFDKEEEEKKIHDAFFGQRVLQDQELHKQFSKRYYSDYQIEQLLGMHKGFVNKLTGSFLITFNDRDKLEKQVVDLGLNIKNFVKKVHIPDFVRFVSDPDSVADHQYDEYSHNQHARGTRHVRKHFEYSQECFDVIKEYKELFADILDAMQRGMRINKQLLTLKDVFGKSVDEIKMVNRIRKVTQWIEACPLSHLPYVEMGFDALHEDLIQKLDFTQRDIKSEKYQSIKLKCRNHEFLQPSFIYQENFPYWSPPFSDKQVGDYRVGDRVININSSKREYVPFGLRGTVVGHTNDRVIVLFDEQYLGGHNIHGHCQELRGGNINPNYLVNLTHKFSQILKKNAALVLNFQEQIFSGDLSALTGGVSQPQVQQQQQFRPVQQQKPHHQPRFQPKPQTLQGAGEEQKQQERSQPQYVAKKQPIPQQQMTQGAGDALAEAMPEKQPSHIEDETEDEYQDLGELQKQSSVKTQMKVDAPAFVPTFTPVEAPMVDVVPDDDEMEAFNQEQEEIVESGFIATEVAQTLVSNAGLPQMDGGAPMFQLDLNPNLMGNPDFNQLLTLMNQLASQIQAPVFDPNQAESNGAEPSSSQDQQKEEQKPDDNQ